VPAKQIVDAATHSRLAELKQLVKRGGDINACYRNYRGLHALIQTRPHADATEPSAKQLACFKWMLAHGADPESLGAWPSARAIIIAAFRGAPEYIELLRDAGAKIDFFAHAALGDVAAVKRALARDPALASARDTGGLTALQCAAGSRLFRSAARPQAAKQKQVDIARMLLDAGADPHAATRSWGHDVDAVYFAASSRNLDVFELLLDRGAGATSTLTPALWNSGKEFPQFAEAALRRGARINKSVSAGRPLLNDLIRWGQLPQVFWLLDHGADPNRADDNGWTALHQAASRGNVRVVEALLAKGADVSRKDAAGRTPHVIAKVKQLRSILT
jgi:ankyrin repeat protein